MVQSPKIRHSKPQREPVTIDLEADPVKREETVETEAAAEPAAAQPEADMADIPGTASTQDGTQGTDETARPHAGGSGDPVAPMAGAGERSSGGGRGFAAGLAGGALVLLAGAGLLYSGLLPRADDASVEMRQEIAALRQEVEALSNARPDAGAEALRGEIDAVSQRIGAAEQALAELRQAVADGGSGEAPDLASLQDRLTEIEGRLASLGVGGADPAALSALGDRVGRVEGELSSILQSVSAAQAGTAENARRLGEFEERLASLAQSLQEDTGDQRLARIVAATALKAAIDRGGPFRAELTAFGAVAPDAASAAALEPYADRGVPTRAALISAVPAAASAMVAAANPVPADAGIVDRLAASAWSLVSVRPIGAVEGTDAPSTVARLEAAVNVGDYARAVAEYEALPEPARQAGEAFAADLRARLAAERVVEGALTAAIQSQ